VQERSRGRHARKADTELDTVNTNTTGGMTRQWYGPLPVPAGGLALLGAGAGKLVRSPAAKLQESGRDQLQQETEAN
jgi:hypothetical protein